MANQYKDSAQDIEKQVVSLTSELQELQKVILAISQSSQKIFNGASSSAKEVQSAIEKVNAETEKLNETNKKAIVVNGKIKVKQNELAKSMIALNKQREKEEKATAKQIAKNNELSRAYVKLVNQQKQAKKTLQDLMVSKGKDNALTKKAQREYDKLTKKVNQVNKATSNFSKTGLGSMARGFKNLLGAFGVIGGIQMFANMTQEVFNMVKKLESLNFALKAVTSGSGELIRTQEFLSKISKDYGASIVGTTERYIKFLAAAKQSNVTMKDTEEIFSIVTKAAGVLGLKTDELSGIYLALEQMLSKGKVTTEELRRQLGERLPGAFGIMADALGVTTAELDKMLRKGEILSNEALPKFAKQLANIPYLKNAKDIDTVVASQNRLNNSWIELIQNIEEGDGGLSKFFKTLLDGTTDFIDIISKSDQGSEGFFDFFRNIGLYANGYGNLVDAMAKESKDKEKRLKLTNELSDLMRRDLKGKEKEVEYNGKIYKFKITEQEIERKIHNLKSLTLEQLSKEIERLNEKEKLINDISLKDKTITLVELEKMTVEELKEKWKELFGVKEEENKETVKYLKGTLAYYEAQISIAKQNLKNQSKTKEEYSSQLKILTDLEKKLKDLRKTLGIKDKVVGIGLETKGLDDGKDKLTDFQKKLIKFLDTLKTAEEIPELLPLSKETQDRLDKYNRGLKTTEERISILKDIFGTVTDTFSDMFDLDISKFDFIFDSLKDKSDKLFSGENIGEWAELSKELIGSVLDASMNRYDIELQAAQRNRDLILDNDLATEEAKENARKKFEEKERQINIKKAKQERENNLIKIAIDTAVAVTKTFAELGFLGGLPFAGAMIAIGATQAAIVASQPLPQFYKGVENSSYEGWATKDERGAELHFDKHGNLKDLGQNKGAKKTFVERGDTIIPAMQTKSILEQFDMDNINKAVFNMNAFSNGQILKERSVDNSLLREIGSLKTSNEKIWGEVKKLASRPIKNNVKVELKDERAY